MGLVNQKADIEIPEDWCQVLETARSKPTPYSVIRFSRDNFLGITDHIKSLYK
ncbi:hypothetical protein PoB_000722600, partial [Plakobranchus ocellatus]